MVESKPSPQEIAVINTLGRILTGRVPLEEITKEDWAPIARAAIRHKLGPLLAWTLEQRGFQVPDAPVQQALQSNAKIADFNFQLLLENQAVIGPALAQAGIPVIWLKGMALAQTVYPRPYLRPMDDIDLLVPYEQREAALQVLRSLDYRTPPQDSLSQKMGAPQDAPHHFHLLGGPGGSTNLELHYRLLVDDRLLQLGEMDWFWQESEIHASAGGSNAFRLLKPEAHLIYLAAHAILQHGEADFRLQRYYDLHLLAQQPGLDWGVIIDRAQALGWIYALERALTLTREYFATPIPNQVFAEIQSRRQPEETALRAQRLQGAGYRWEGTLLGMEDRPLLERLRSLFWLAFPPFTYMRSRYNIPPGRAVLPYYFLRWSDAAREISSALLRRLR